MMTGRHYKLLGRDGRVVGSKWWMGACCLLQVLLLSCTAGGYDSGDGLYSYYSADLAMVHTLDKGVADYMLTDEGDSVHFSPLVSWANAGRADSMYRSLVYYSKESGAASSVFAISEVPVLRPSAMADTVTTDPLVFEAGWISTDNHWLNLRLSLKTGSSATTGDSRQSLAVSQDSIRTSPDGTEEIWLTLRHGQNGVPEYYSESIYASIPLSGMPAGSLVRLAIPTYDGILMRNYRMR